MTAHRRCLRLLIADDNHDAADTLAELLRTLGHSATVVYDGLAATEAAVAHQYDLIVLDVSMPVLTGMEAARHIRQHFGADVRPLLVALTALSAERDRLATAEAGFDVHLTKPIRSDQLLTLLT